MKKNDGDGENENKVLSIIESYFEDDENFEVIEQDDNQYLIVYNISDGNTNNKIFGIKVTL